MQRARRTARINSLCLECSGKQNRSGRMRRMRGVARSRIEAHPGPSIPLPAEEKSVVKPMRAVDPELDARGMQAISTPEIGARNLAGMGRGEGADVLLEQRAALKNAALLGNGSADLAVT